jgi:hypothetical protein
MSACKLRHYFEAHTIRALTDQPLHDIFRNRDSSGRISKCAMELSEYVVDFEKHSAIKFQVLADFMVEWTEPSSTTEVVVPEEPWLVTVTELGGGSRCQHNCHINLTFGDQVTVCSEVGV